MNLPNKLTMLRVLLIPVFMVCAANRWMLAAGIIFAAASLTDYFDGHLARKNNLVTDFGKFADPLADKLMVLTMLYMLSTRAYIPMWVLIVVAGATMSFQGAMTVQSDRSTQWDRFSAVLPLPRSTAVSEKYVLYLLLCALGMALGLAVGAIAAALGRAPDPEELYLYASTAVIVCLMTGSVNLPCTFVLTAEKSLAGIILCDILVSALFAGGIFALRQVMDVKLHMRTVLGLGAALSALCYGISWIIAARRLPMRDR